MEQPAPTPGEYTADDYRADCAKIKAEADGWSSLLGEEEKLRAVAIWLNASPEDRGSDRMAWARDRVAAGYPNGAPLPREHRLPALMQDVRDRIELALPKWHAAQQAFQVAQSRETSRIAKQLAPKLPALVKRLAAAVEELSRATAAAEDIQQELARRSPLGRSLYLPDVVAELSVIGRFGDWRSHAEAWRRRMVNQGLL